LEVKVWVAEVKVVVTTVIVVQQQQAPNQASSSLGCILEEAFHHIQQEASKEGSHLAFDDISPLQVLVPYYDLASCRLDPCFLGHLFLYHRLCHGLSIHLCLGNRPCNLHHQQVTVKHNLETDPDSFLDLGRISFLLY
jgi:hypothetical protein